MWQLVNETMPASGVDVLLYFRSKEYYIGQWNSRSQVFLFKEFFVPKNDVLAWMPIPSFELKEERST